MIKCELCGVREDERSMQDQCGVFLCRRCVNYYSDEELEELLETEKKLEEFNDIDKRLRKMWGED
tara:strand:- start:9939 stop:10133 length:195 start_codon:yes stop_codon:yes gene_type:complete